MLICTTNSTTSPNLNGILRELRKRRSALSAEAQRTYDPFAAGQVEGLDIAIHALLRARHGVEDAPDGA